MAYRKYMITITNDKLAALADPTRQSLLQMLRRKPMPVGELASHLPISRPAVSQHLKVLSSAKLVNEERNGTRHYFSLNPKGFEEIHAYISSMWQDSLNSFSNYVNEKESGKRNKARRKK